MDLLGVVHAHLLSLLEAPRSVVNLDSPGYYIHWHWIYISAANLIVIGLMLVVFVLAILVPFPRHRSGQDGTDG
jgi:hypothetical protein